MQKFEIQSKCIFQSDSCGGVQNVNAVGESYSVLITTDQDPSKNYTGFQLVKAALQ
jgi:hypothetical protein